MLARNFACLVLIAGGLCSAPGWRARAGRGRQAACSRSQKTIGVVTPTGPVPSLFVVNSAGAKLEGGKLTMTGVAANSIVFADRPVRAAGHVTTEQFIMQWDEGKDSFAKDPPNATVSVLGGDGSKVERRRGDVEDAEARRRQPDLRRCRCWKEVWADRADRQRCSSTGSVASAAAASTRAALGASTRRLWWLPRRRLRRRARRRLPWRRVGWRQLLARPRLSWCLVWRGCRGSGWPCRRSCVGSSRGGPLLLWIWPVRLLPVSAVLLGR